MSDLKCVNNVTFLKNYVTLFFQDWSPLSNKYFTRIDLPEIVEEKSIVVKYHGICDFHKTGTKLSGMFCYKVNGRIIWEQLFD